MRIQERMHIIKLGLVTVRVWARSEDLLVESERASQRKMIEGCITNAINARRPTDSWNKQCTDIAEEVAKLEFCNAVEVLQRDGNGVLIYPEWP